MFAILLGALLGTTGLVYTAGTVFAARRSLQSAADAASLSGAWQVLSQAQVDDRFDGTIEDDAEDDVDDDPATEDDRNRDAMADDGSDQDPSLSAMDGAVLQAVLLLAAENGVGADGTTTNATFVSAVYVDEDGENLVGDDGGVVPVGGSTLPPLAGGVRVTVRGRVPTVLPSFVGGSSVPVEATSVATSVAVASTATTGWGVRAIPIAVNLKDFRAAYPGKQRKGGTFKPKQVNLFKSTVAPLGKKGTVPVLDYSGIDGAGGYGTLDRNLQYWSDGQHDAPILASGSLVPLAELSSKGSREQALRAIVAGLRDNIRGQSPEQAKVSQRFALVTVPLWDGVQDDPPRLRLVGFATMKLRWKDVKTNGPKGTFVRFAATPVSWKEPLSSGDDDFGARMVRIVW